MIFSHRYQKVKVLGVGGMGCVYQVKDLLLEELGINQEYALKVMNQEMSLFEDAEGLLLNEWCIGQKLLFSDNVLTHYGLFHCDKQDKSYLLMPVLQGDQLSYVLPMLSGALRCDFSMQLMKSVLFCHQNGVIHGDLKPCNIFITPHNRIILYDFSLSRSLDDSENKWAMDLTKVKGWSSRYASKSILKGNPASIEDDHYALSIILYQLLFAQLPTEEVFFDGEVKRIFKVTNKQKQWQILLQIKNELSLVFNAKKPHKLNMTRIEILLKQVSLSIDTVNKKRSLCKRIIKFILK